MRSLNETKIQDTEPQQGAQDRPLVPEVKPLVKLIKKKRFVVAIFFGILFLGIALLFKPKRYNLTINTLPEGSTITVSDKHKSVTKFEKELPAGTYKVVVSKENYLTEEKEIGLSSDTVLSIILVQDIKSFELKTARIESVEPFSATNLFPSSKDSLIGIDQATSSLIKITPKSVTTIYSKPVSFYSFVSPLVALLEKDNFGKIIIIDTKTNEIRSISAENLSSIISVSISPDLKNIFILGNYSSSTRISKLYVSALENFSPKEIFTTKADIIESLSTTQVAIFESADALDKGSLSIFDLEQDKVVFSTTGNDYFVSPSRSSIAVQTSKSVTVVDIKSLSKKTVSLLDSKIAWKDDSTLVIVKNRNPGVDISYLNIDVLKTTSSVSIESLKQISIRSLVGVVGDFLFAIDTQGKIWQITLP